MAPEDTVLKAETLRRLVSARVWSRPATAQEARAVVRAAGGGGQRPTHTSSSLQASLQQCTAPSGPTEDEEVPEAGDRLSSLQSVLAGPG